MARYYGSWKTLHTNIKTRAFIDVTTSSTTTTFTVSTNIGYQVQRTKRTGSAVHNVKYDNLAATILDNNNVIYLNNGSYAGHSFTDSATQTHTYGPYSAHTHTYSRGTSAQTIKVTQKIAGQISSTTTTGSTSSTTIGPVIWSVTSDNITIPAKPSYTVTYNANGGSIVSGGKSYDTKQYGTVISLPKATNFTRSGYQPVKFNKSAKGTDTSYNFGANYTVTAAATLYVIWQQDYTVKYDPNGGTGGPTTQAKQYNKPLTLTTTKPTREGYSFLGWATSSSSTTVAYKGGETYNSNANLYLYAVWKLEYDSRTVYELNVRGEYNASQKEIPRATQKVAGNSIEAYAEFLGWAIEKPTNPIYPPRITSIEDITDIKVYTDINSSMSDTFYAIYRDISPSNIYEIYHDTVIANDSEDIVVEFQNYIDAISSGEDYISTAIGDSHTLFGYVQCNTNVDILNNVSGTIDNCRNKVIQSVNSYATTTNQTYSISGNPQVGTNIYVNMLIEATQDPISCTIVAGLDFADFIYTPYGDIYIEYNSINNTVSWWAEDNTLVLRGLKLTTITYLENTGETSTESLDNIQQISNYIFYRKTNDNITTSSKHTITITGVDSQNKSVSFIIKNTIKIPLIDIQPKSIVHSVNEDKASVTLRQTNLIIENNRKVVTNSTSLDNTFVTCTRTDNPNADVSFGIGAGGKNRGIWLHNKDSSLDAASDGGNWLIYGNHVKSTTGLTWTHIPGHLVLEGHNSNVGYVVQDYLENAVPNPHDTWQTIGIITLDPGKWLIYMTAQWNSQNSGHYNGYSCVGLSSTETGAAWSGAAYFNNQGLNVNYKISTMVFRTPNSRTTYYCRAKQTTGGTQTMPAGSSNGGNCIYAMRIV